MIRPEERHRRKHLCVSEDIARHRVRLLGGVHAVLEADVPVDHRMEPAGNVTRSPDARRRSAVLVADDTVIDH